MVCIVLVDLFTSSVWCCWWWWRVAVVLVVIVVVARARARMCVCTHAHAGFMLCVLVRAPPYEMCLCVQSPSTRSVEDAHTDLI